MCAVPGLQVDTETLELKASLLGALAVSEASGDGVVAVGVGRAVQVERRATEAVDDVEGGLVLGQ